jgi:ketosteroid isomerase-like protein
MPTRRAANLLLAVALLLVQAGVHAQGKAAPSEASLREAIAHYVATWNRHDVPAWSALLTDDIWYTEAEDYYQRQKGRPAVISFFGDLVKTSDLKWEITRVKVMPDGTATVVMRHFALILPKTGEKYASTFESTPSVSRWRIEGDRWRMFYFTSHKGRALAEMKKDGID